MRIPSQFNDESLYRRGARRGENAQALRRLFRLVLGLALVVVVMQQAARPEIYRAFFGQGSGTLGQGAETLGQGAETLGRGAETLGRGSGTAPAVAAIAEAEAQDGPVRAGGGASAGGSPDESAAAPVHGGADVDAEDREIAQALTESLLPSDRRQWTYLLVRWQSGRPFGIVPSTIESLQLDLSQDQSFDDSRRESWQAMFDRLNRLAETEPERPSDGGDDAGGAPFPEPRFGPVIAAWLTELDEAAEATVVDGSTWRGGDFEAFYRYLDQANELSGKNVAATGVIPLLQQPEVYRGQLVRVGGGVARAEQLPAQANVYGIDDYWQLWLRPTDGADRPLLVIVPRVSQEVAAVGADAMLDEGPPVAVVGRYLKRLAYRSGAGADLAPVVVGRLLTVAAPVALSDADAAGDFSRLALTVAVAIVVGLLLAVMAMWRTAVAGRRVRELHATHRKRPDEFLQRLSGDEVSGIESEQAAESPADETNPEDDPR